MKIRLQRNLYEGADKGYTQLFGENPASYEKFGMLGHNGLDIPIPTGTKLFSCINGTVTEVLDDTTGYGKYVKVENDECGVLYAHMKEQLVKVNDKVTAGDVLGTSNNTGNSTGSHLHFGVFLKPRDRGNGYAGYINPLDNNLIEWVDNFTTSDPLDELQEKYDKLLDELISMRQSRDKWKTSYDELSKKYVSDSQSSTEHIKNLQSTVAEQASQIVNMNETIKQSSLEKKSLLEANRASELRYLDITASNEDAMEQINKDFKKERLRAEKAEKEAEILKEKLSMKISGYSKKELFFKLFLKMMGR